MLRVESRLEILIRLSTIQAENKSRLNEPKLELDTGRKSLWEAISGKIRKETKAARQHLNLELCFLFQENIVESAQEADSIFVHMEAFTIISKFEVPKHTK